MSEVRVISRLDFRKVCNAAIARVLEVDPGCSIATQALVIHGVGEALIALGYHRESKEEE